MDRRRYLMALANVPQFRLKTYENLYHDLIVDTLDNRPVRNQGIDKLVSISGNGEIVNQLVNFYDGNTGYYNITNEYTIEYNNTTMNWRTLINITLDGSHTYLLMFYDSNSSSQSDSTYQFFASNIGYYFGKEITNVLITNISTIQLRTALYDSNTHTGTFKMNCIDLTQMFGTSNEPTDLTDNRVKKLLAKYHPYNSGTYKGSIVDSIETKGFNIWDEIAELGTISDSTGENINASNTLRSKNYISVFPNTTYYQWFLTNQKNNLFYYDKNHNFISYEQIRFQNTFTTPNGCYFVRFRLDSGYGTTYNHDICINHSSSRNGEYVPFASFNIWNENWETGAFNDYGEVASSTLSLRTKDYVNCKSNENYYCKIPSLRSGARFIVYFYNSSKTFINKLYLDTTTNIFAVPSNATYLKFCFEYYIADYTQYNYDICINKSCDKNGLYLPFGVLDSIKLPAPIQLDGAINSHNTFEVLKESYKFTRNVFDYTFTGNETYNFGTWATDTISVRIGGLTNIGTGYNRFMLTSSIKYTDTYILISGSDAYVRFIDSTNYYTDINDFKNALGNAKMVYQLATPQVISIPKKHLNAVELGSLNWYYNNSKNCWYAHLDEAKVNNSNPQIYCSNYETSTANLWDVSYNGIALTTWLGTGHNELICRNSSSTIKPTGYLFFETENEVEDFINEESFQRGGEVMSYGEKYLEVEYLESSGTQYIDTGLTTGSEITKIQAHYYRTIASRQQILFGAYGGSNSTIDYYDYTENDIQTKCYWFGSQLLNVNVSIEEVNSSFEVNGNTLTYTYNGNAITGTKSYSASGSTNLYLFNYNENGNVGEYGFKCKMYSFKVWVGGTLLRDFVPCIRAKDNVAGLFDKVSGKFFTNQGTGTFTTGNFVRYFDDSECLANVELKIQVK